MGCERSEVGCTGPCLLVDNRERNLMIANVHHHESDLTRRRLKRHSGEMRRARDLRLQA